MKQDEALERIKDIQRIAERTTLYTQLPGLAAIIGGILALFGCIISYQLIGSVDFGALINVTASKQLMFIITWACIGIIAIVQEIILTTHDAKKHGINPLSRPGKLSAYSLTPSLFIAAIITLKLLLDITSSIAPHSIRYIAPVWMMCYGTGIYAAGLFSVRLPRLLGLAFIILGAVSIMYLDYYGVILVALTFGMLHIIFGAIVMHRAKKRNKRNDSHDNTR
ncbi:MAG: hypothetical protein A2Y62_22095 [Candidatus Fischerbacteria bacterium RBG_13_37_8]|uniref:Uncharacterized protein n=1 Tax=Candidatus Fischerbacteria bacterium RBG_13_37_8 TaxID=1817863 RepID=A0A1F5VXD4_9BACT|nr:MAG: hypothetical protein A2Y62_22095 [Candidatus Fischerbacteria bacterium RBG_13_37_8]